MKETATVMHITPMYALSHGTKPAPIKNPIGTKNAEKDINETSPLYTGSLVDLLV